MGVSGFSNQEVKAKIISQPQIMANTIQNSASNCVSGGGIQSQNQNQNQIISMPTKRPNNNHNHESLPKLIKIENDTSKIEETPNLAENDTEATSIQVQQSVCENVLGQSNDNHDHNNKNMNTINENHIQNSNQIVGQAVKSLNDITSANLSNIGNILVDSSQLQQQIHQQQQQHQQQQSSQAIYNMTAAANANLDPNSPENSHLSTNFEAKRILALKNVGEYLEKHHQVITRTNTAEPVDDLEFIADQRKFIQIRKGVYSYFERPSKGGSHKCIQITVLVHETKKTWKAFLNGKRIFRVNISENEYIPHNLTIADFDSLLEHLTLIRPENSYHHQIGNFRYDNRHNSNLDIPQTAETNNHLINLLNELQTERKTELTKYRSLEKEIKKILVKQSSDDGLIQTPPSNLENGNSNHNSNSSPQPNTSSVSNNSPQEFNVGSSSNCSNCSENNKNKKNKLSRKNSSSNTNNEFSTVQSKASKSSKSSRETIPISASAAAGLHSNQVSVCASGNSSKSQIITSGSKSEENQTENKNKTNNNNSNKRKNPSPTGLIPSIKSKLDHQSKNTSKNYQILEKPKLQSKKTHASDNSNINSNNTISSTSKAEGSGGSSSGIQIGNRISSGGDSDGKIHQGSSGVEGAQQNKIGNDERHTCSSQSKT